MILIFDFCIILCYLKGGKGGLPLSFGHPLSNVPFNAIAWRMIPAIGVGWGRSESTVPASTFLFSHFFYGRVILLAFVAFPGQFGGYGST